MASMCVEINTTRDIAAQIIRHRSFSFQEFSQRYADVKDLGTIQIPELRRQDTKNRQNSIDDLDPELVKAFEKRVKMLFAESQELYDDMLDAGIAKESARKVLPMNSPSRIYMTGTLRSWMHYIDLRSANGTQKEHKDIACAISDIFTEQFPSIQQALWEIQGEPIQSSPAEYKVPEGFTLVPTPRTQQKRRRERLKEWFDKNIFGI